MRILCIDNNPKTYEMFGKKIDCTGNGLVEGHTYIADGEVFKFWGVMVYKIEGMGLKLAERFIPLDEVEEEELEEMLVEDLELSN